MTDGLSLQRMAKGNELLQSLDDKSIAMLALGEEQLNVARQQLDALKTQNLIAWLQLERASGNYDQKLVDDVRRRLGLGLQDSVTSWGSPPAAPMTGAQNETDQRS